MTGPYLRPPLLRLAAGVWFAAIFAVLYLVSDPAQAGALLFVVPIALLALSDGLRGGVTGALLGVALVAVWVLTDDVDLTALGWISRIASFFVIGLLVGRFEDLARAYERRRLDERYAAELHDRVVQTLTVARYQLEGHPEAQRAVDSALEGAKDIISSRLPGLEPGDLRISEPHPPSPPS